MTPTIDMDYCVTVGEEVDEVSALKTAQTVAEQLHAIAAVRQHFTDYK